MDKKKLHEYTNKELLTLLALRIVSSERAGLLCAEILIRMNEKSPLLEDEEKKLDLNKTVTLKLPE